MSQPDMPEMPMFNTTELHVQAAVNMALATDT
jgi:aspartate/glutamate racemase